MSVLSGLFFKEMYELLVRECQTVRINGVSVGRGSTVFVIFVVLQIKIIHVSMSRTIDRNNPVENSSCGHPPYPSEISTL